MLALASSVVDSTIKDEKVKQRIELFDASRVAVRMTILVANSAVKSTNQSGQGICERREAEGAWQGDDCNVCTDALPCIYLFVFTQGQGDDLSLMVLKSITGRN